MNSHGPGLDLLLALMPAAIVIALRGWGLAHYLYKVRPGMRRSAGRANPARLYDPC